MSRSRVLPGLALTACIALPAVWLGALLPVIGAPVFGIVLGTAAGCILRRAVPSHLRCCGPGFAVAGKHVLQAGIVVMGFGLSLPDIVRVGRASLPIMLGTLATALAGAWILGRLLRLHEETRVLIGVGTAICGASAIAMVTAVIRPAQERVAYALGTIFTFNIMAVFAYPALGHLLGLSEPAFGLWAGTAINDTSSVVAAAYSFGAAAGSYAVVVKLTRSLMIVPICLVLQARQRRRAAQDDRRMRQPMWRAFPLFIVGFLAASLLTSTGIVHAQWQPTLSYAATLLITTALAGIGLTLNLGQLRAAGGRPLLFGGLLSVAVGATGLGLQYLTGQI